MRRRDKEITDRAEMEAVLGRVRFGHLALCDRGEPYIVALDHGYADGRIYFHSAPEGRKLDIVRANPRVCYQVTEDLGLVSGERACDFGRRYISVVCAGRAAKVEDGAEKVRGLDAIMAAHGGPRGDYDPDRLARTAVVRIDVLSMTGKKSGV